MKNVGGCHFFIKWVKIFYLFDIETVNTIGWLQPSVFGGRIDNLFQMK